MTTPSTPREPWNDDRLNAAFAARASRARTPLDLPRATLALLQTPPARNAAWRRLLVPAAVLVLAVGTLTGGVSLLGDRGGGTMFREGPTADLKTFDRGDFSFDYPADWLGYDATAEFGVGSSIAVLGTQPVEPRCGGEGHVDIDCVQLQALETGRIRVFIGTGVFHGAAILDRADIENARSTQITVGGMPAILDEYDPRPDSSNRQDMLVRWAIARPGTDGTNVYRIEAMLREPGVAAGRAQLDALIASIRIDAAASPSPSAASFQPQAAGLRVFSVREAIEIRDAGVDDHEIAVRGWYAAHAPLRACGRQQFPEPVSPLQARCPDRLLWLTQDREQLTTTTATSTSWHGPTGLAISPHFNDVETAWSAPADDPFRLHELVVIGHFDDSGSGLCPAAEELACRDRFVVDRVDSVDGVSQPLSVVDRVDGSETSTTDDIRAAVDKRSLGRPILSLVIVDARLEGLTDGPSPTIWVARVLGEQVVEHHVVFDGTDEVFMVRMSGPPKYAVPLDPSGPPSHVLDLPVISVSELIARRDAGPSPEEIAVRGWALRSSVVYDCAIHMDPHHLLVPFCQSPIFLMEQREATAGATTAGPSVPMLLGPDAHVEVEIPYVGPVDVIAIGHFDDHRWPTCPADEQDACRQRFVIDRIVPVGGPVEEIPDAWRMPPSSSSEPSADPNDVIRRVEATVGDITVVSLGHVEGDVLREIEPGVPDPVGPDGDAALMVRPLWVVRALVATGPDPSVARTFLIPDVAVDEPSATIWDASESGVVAVPDPGTALPWPPDGATMVELPVDLGSERPPVRVAVVDQTGRLVDARAATAAERVVRDLSYRAVRADDLPYGRVLVHWSGSMCDDRLTLTITAFDAGTPFTLTVDGRRGSPCRLALVYYAVVLEFEPAIGAADLGGRYLIGP